MLINNKLVCLFCGKTFETYDLRRKYCSTKCLKSRVRQKNREDMRKRYANPETRRKVQLSNSRAQQRRRALNRCRDNNNENM